MVRKGERQGRRAIYTLAEVNAAIRFRGQPSVLCLKTRLGWLAGWLAGWLLG